MSIFLDTPPSTPTLPTLHTNISHTFQFSPSTTVSSKQPTFLEVWIQPTTTLNHLCRQAYDIIVNNKNTTTPLHRQTSHTPRSPSACSLPGITTTPPQLEVAMLWQPVAMIRTRWSPIISTMRASVVAQGPYLPVSYPSLFPLPTVQLETAP